MDLIDVILELESSVCTRMVRDTGGDFTVHLINSWVNNSDLILVCLIDNDVEIENFNRIDLIPINGDIHIYVWYEVLGSHLFNDYLLDEISSFMINVIE